jgi:hypothetical protein
MGKTLFCRAKPYALRATLLHPNVEPHIRLGNGISFWKNPHEVVLAPSGS